MDYFNFEDAAVPPFDLDEVSSLNPECYEEDGQECFESLFFDKTACLPADKPSPVNTIRLKLINNCEVEAVRHNDDSTGDWPIFRAKEPCSLCARMNMDCYLASRGMLITGCTACISLYRECSFTHPQMPKGYVNTFPGIAEDQQVCHGPVTRQTQALASYDIKGRKAGSRFPRDAVKILKTWLSEHADHPYPNEREKDELKQLTGLKRSQIANWLANARRRGKVRPPSGPPSPMLGAVDIPHPKCNDISNLGPMDRWKQSPPEHEPATMTAIARAITTNPLEMSSRQNSISNSRNNSRPSSRKNSSEDDSTNMSMFRAPSVSSFETKDSSNSDFSLASSRSHKSRNSYASSNERRRRRRAPLTQRTAAQAPAMKDAQARAARIFQCTFCTDTFPAKYDWQRHEKSLHLALERWTCCPMGGTRIDPITGQHQCVFCPVLSPSEEHLESHNFLVCQEKTLQERTFYRKDHLRQHLKLMHGVKFDPHMDTWKSTTFEIKSRCGFCPSKFTTWQQRADHLAAHFRNGADMSNWSGNWGFEPYVEKLVENSIPPYLIGHERLTMNPYVARAAHDTSPNSILTSGTSGMDTSDRVEVAQITKDNNCWGRLEADLAKYVIEQRALGVIPTDIQMQNYAREIIYGDPDPFDFTCADNGTWLDAFKAEHGILRSTDPTPEFSEVAAVPIMPPYVIKGGLKNKRTSESRPRSSAGSVSGALDISAVGTCRYSSATSSNLGQTPLTPLDSEGMFDFNTPVALDEGAMDLDFEGLDFNAMDLNGFGEMDFADSSAVVSPAPVFGQQYSSAQQGFPSMDMNIFGAKSARQNVQAPQNLNGAPQEEQELSMDAINQLLYGE